MSLSIDAPPFRTYRAEGRRAGLFHIWWDGDAVIATEASGYIGDEGATEFFDVFDLAAREAKRPITIVHDWSQVTGHAISVGVRMTRKSLLTFSQWSRVWIAVDHPLIAASVMSAAVTLKGRVNRVSRTELLERLAQVDRKRGWRSAQSKWPAARRND